MGKGAAAVIRNLAAEREACILLHFLYRQRVAFVEEAAGDSKILAHHGGVLGAHPGEALVHIPVCRNQVCLPVETLEHDHPLRRCPEKAAAASGVATPPQRIKPGFWAAGPRPFPSGWRKGLPRFPC